jgi:ATP-dependent protease HslVU (ClpYQ) peptidase subunit
MLRTLYRNKLFRVYDSLSVFAIPEFSAIGSGADFAIAAMHLGNEPKVAAKVASELDLYCAGQIDEVVHSNHN